MRPLKYIVSKNEMISPTVALLTLKPVSANARLRFAAGQYVSLGFVRNGRPTPMRCFSIVNSPGEKALQVAVRVRGDFTATAAEMAPGSPATVLGPFGEFVFNGSARQLVLIAGGIGVTPFISMIRHAAAIKWPGEIVLLYGNQNQADMPFANELDAWSRAGRVRVVYAISGGGKEPVPGRATVSGRISEQLLAPEVQANTVYYVCGPAGFMSSAMTQLRNLGVPNERVMSESFGQSKGGSGVQAAVYGLTAVMIMAGTGYFALKHFIESGSTVSPTPSAAEPLTPRGSTSNTPATTPYQAPQTSVS